jgi:hypothetical protein
VLRLLDEHGDADAFQRLQREGKTRRLSDFFGKEPYATIWESTKEILRENDMAIPPPTRWSGKYLAMQHIRLTKGAKVHVVSPTEYGRIGVVEKALHPFFSATQILQSDGSTLVDAVRVFAWLLSMPTKSEASTALQQALKARSEFIITDMLLLVCFFFPSLKRHHVPGLVREHVGRLVRGACGRIAEIYDGDIAAEWVRFQVEPPVPAPCDQAFDVDVLRLVGGARGDLPNVIPRDARDREDAPYGGGVRACLFPAEVCLQSAA